jgi:CRP/FNR family transcriptional regulator, polysaccharide utilization system transcription regulator
MLINEKRGNCVSCTKKCDIFKLLTKEELEIINKNKHEVVFKPKEIILKQGTALTHLVAVIEGLTKIYIEGYSSKDVILKIQKPGEIIAGPGLYTDRKNHFSIAALLPTSTCFINVDAFRQVVRQNRDFSEAFMKEFSYRSINAFETIINLTQKQMHGRIADVLIYLSDQIFHSLCFNMVISRQDLADMSAMSKESCCRILKEFKDEGLLTAKGNYLEILNINQLRHISVNGY